MLVISVSVSVQQVECQYAVRTRNVPRWLVRLVAPELVVLARSFWYSRLRCRYSNLAVTWLQSGQWLKAVEAGRHAIIWAGWVYSVDAAFLARHGVRMDRVISQLALSVANLRRTAHSTGSSAGNLGDVQRFEHSPSVAVVTLCAYNASSSKLAQLSMSNKVRYCRIHSCTFVPFTERLDADRPIPWSKVLLVAFQICVLFSPWHGQILALQEVLHRQGVEWVMWMDCDSFFMNFTISPSSMLARLGAFSANNPDVWLTEDGVMINSGASAAYVADLSCQFLKHRYAGVMFLKNSPFSRAMLGALAGPTYAAFASHPFWEQAALFHYLQRQSAELAKRVGIAPQRLLNSYPHVLADNLRGPSGESLHTPYSKCAGGVRVIHVLAIAERFVCRGDYIISFSGCAKDLGAHHCEALFQHFYLLSVQDASAAATK